MRIAIKNHLRLMQPLMLLFGLSFGNVDWAEPPKSETCAAESGEAIDPPGAPFADAKVEDMHWDALAAYAGKPVDGFLLEARLTPVSPVQGAPAALAVTVRNVSDRDRYVAMPKRTRFDVLIRDSRGVGVKWTSAGEELRDVGPFLDGGGTLGPTQPGWGVPLSCHWREDAPLECYFQLPGPGKYTMLVSGGVDRDGTAVINGKRQSVSRCTRAVAMPLSFVLRPASESPGRNALETDPPAVPVIPRPRGMHFSPREWNEILAAVGKPRHGLLLDAIVSPVLSGGMHLVVSAVNLGRPPDQDPAPHRRRGRYKDLQSGAFPCDYWLLVCDEAGNVVPLTEQGRAMFAVPHEAQEHWLGLGAARGAIFALQDLYAFPHPGTYTVVATLTQPYSDFPTWVAQPVKINVK